MLLLLTLLACDEPAEETASVPADPGDTLVELDAPRLLRRISLDVRGVLPSREELDAVEADPSLIDSYLEAYLADDEHFEDRLVSLFSERWLTRLDKFEIQYYDYQLDPVAEFPFEQAVGEEPLRLMARIAVLDRPWTDIVTGDYTVANELLASIWPIDYPEGETGWQISSYTDGRPAVGVLATNGLWWRYVTNISNMNRSRAAAISRLLLCQDLLSRPVSISGAVTLSEEDGTTSAIRSNDSCVACHSTVEPLASALFGWWTVISYNPDEMGYYHAERERLGTEYLGYAPGFFGEPLDGLVDLGPAIANDTRFYSCAAESTAELFWRRPVESTDFERVEALRDQFLAQGLSYKALIKDVIATPEYRAGGVTDAATDETVERERTVRLVTPDLMDSAVEELTGYAWMYEGFNQMENDNPGYRTLAGGVDGYAVTRAQQDPGITWIVTMKRFTQGAASYVVDQELNQGAERRMLMYVTSASRPGDTDFDKEIAELCWRLYAERPADDHLAALTSFWSQVYEQEGVDAAWSRLLSSMLRDPAFVGY